MVDSCGDAIGRPLIVPLFIPHMGCPHRCIFCNQHAITGQSHQALSPDRIQAEVTCFLRYAKKQPAFTQISFFGGNFLGLGKATIRSLLETANAFVQSGRVDSIRFSTRPDTVEPATLDLLAGFPVSTVELGVQSMRDRILDIADRGHRAADTVSAVNLLKARGYQVGLQMMVGLPGDDNAGAMETARRIVALQPDFVRIYPTLVLKGSPLSQWHHTGRYRPMALEPCIELVKQLYLYFKSSRIAVVRMGLQASDGLHAGECLIAGPYHPAFGHLVLADIVQDAISSALNRMAPTPDRLTVQAHPKMVSRVQGLNKANIHHIQQTYGLADVCLVQDPSLPLDRLVVDGHRVILP